MYAAKLKSLFLSFDGRIGRQTFIAGFVGLLIAAVALRLAFFAIIPAFEYSYALIISYRLLKTFVFGWLTIAIVVKRLHDRGKSSWWLAPFLFVPYMLGTWNDRISEGDPLWWITLGASAALSIWGLIELMLLPGPSEANDYGVPEA